MEKSHKFEWRFPILDGGKRQGINDSGIATFAGSELYNNLAREICQNSLDAKDPDSKEPVIVTFKLMSLYSGAFYPIKGLKEALLSCKKYWSSYEDQKLNSFLDEAFKTLSDEPIEILKISDYNTVGLAGSKTRSGAWDALTGSNGVSFKTNGSQGSFGIGKNAPYACSCLRTVFYNTYAKKDGCKAFQGVTSLVTHLNSDNQETQGCGFYYNTIDRKPIFDNDDCEDAKNFRRNQYGTDIIILGFKKNSNWKNDIKLAIIKNFFIAILDSKLIVKIDDITIDKDTIKAIIDKSINLDNTDDVLKRTKYYIETYLNPDKIFDTKVLKDKDVKLFVKISDDYTRNIAYLRATGMLICEKSIKKMKPYEAVLLVNGTNMNEILKLMEPPKHDKWDYKLLPDDEINKGRKIMSKIRNFINESIESICKIDSPEEIDPDGISSFLPDDIDFICKKGSKNITNYRSETLEIENIKKIKNEISNGTTIGKMSIGEELNGDVHNNTDSGIDFDTIVPKPGNDKINGDDVVTEQPSGSKEITKSLYSTIRLIPINVVKGLYKLIAHFGANYSKVCLNFKMVGEDGSQDVLNIIGYSNNGKFTKINGDNFVINNVIKEQCYTYILCLNVNTRVVIMVGGIGYETE